MKKIYVIKIGSSVLLTKRHKLDQFRMKHLVEQIVVLQERGIGVVLVISGAVAYGSNFIDLSDKLAYKRQAAAGIGQVQVMASLAAIFDKFGLQLAQLLITKELFYLYQEKVKKLIEFYVDSGIIPVINENDILDLNSFGGNDFLAVEIAQLLTTERVVILSTMKGSIHGIGGGATKKQAVEILRKQNIATNVVNGKRKNILLTL